MSFVRPNLSYGTKPNSPTGDLLHSEFHQDVATTSTTPSSKNYPNAAIHETSINFNRSGSPQTQTQTLTPITSSALTSHNHQHQQYNNYQANPNQNNQPPNRSFARQHSTPNNSLGGRKKYISSSKSVTSTTSSARSASRPCALDNPLFAPPPKPPSQSEVKAALTMAHSKRLTSPLPWFDNITHSGHMQARISLKSLVIKKWRPIFWITYGDSEVLLFRSRVDFMEWATNPYLSMVEREEIVKLKIDFKIGRGETPGARCYRAFPLQGKNYGKSGLMHTFKLEQWMHYGPVILGAFASISQTEIAAFHTICKDIIRRQKCGLRHYLSANKKDDEIEDDTRSVRSSYTAKSAPNQSTPGFFY